MQRLGVWTQLLVVDVFRRVGLQTFEHQKILQGHPCPPFKNSFGFPPKNQARFTAGLVLSLYRFIPLTK